MPTQIPFTLSCLCLDAQSGGGAPRAATKDGDHPDANMMSPLPDPIAGMLAYLHKGMLLLSLPIVHPLISPVFSVPEEA